MDRKTGLKNNKIILNLKVLLDLDPVLLVNMLSNEESALVLSITYWG